MRIREARDTDSAQLITLIGDVFAEYPGCVFDVDGEMPQLRHPASAFAGWGGRLWVAEADGTVVGCGGFSDRPPEAVELKHLYVAGSARRQGLGRRFCALVEEDAAERAAAVIELWTDTRFEDAHRLYESLGYVRMPETRELHDLSDSIEYRFVKRLGPGPPTPGCVPRP